MTAPTIERVREMRSAVAAVETEPDTEAATERAEALAVLDWAIAIRTAVEAAPESAEAFVRRMCGYVDGELLPVIRERDAATVARCFAERERLREALTAAERVVVDFGGWLLLCAVDCAPIDGKHVSMIGTFEPDCCSLCIARRAALTPARAALETK